MEFTGIIKSYTKEVKEKGISRVFILENTEEFRGKQYVSGVIVRFFSSEGTRLEDRLKGLWQEGSTVKVQFDPQLREYNGKTYMDLNGYDILMLKGNPEYEAALAQVREEHPGVPVGEALQPKIQQAVEQEAAKGDDLPF